MRNATRPTHGVGISGRVALLIVPVLLAWPSVGIAACGTEDVRQQMVEQYDRLAPQLLSAQKTDPNYGPAGAVSG